MKLKYVEIPNNWLQIKSVDLMTSVLTLKSEFIFVYSVYNVPFIVRFTWRTFCINYFHLTFNGKTNKQTKKEKQPFRNFASTLTW